MARRNWVGKRLFSPIKQALIRYSYVCQSGRGGDGGGCLLWEPGRRYRADSALRDTPRRVFIPANEWEKRLLEAPSWDNEGRPTRDVDVTPALVLKLAPPEGGGRRGCERDYGMAKLHEMSLGAGRAMHKQTMSHHKNKKENKHINLRNKQDFHAINKQIHKQTRRE